MRNRNSHLSELNRGGGLDEKFAAPYSYQRQLHADPIFSLYIGTRDYTLTWPKPRVTGPI